MNWELGAARRVVCVLITIPKARGEWRLRSPPLGRCNGFTTPRLDALGSQMGSFCETPMIQRGDRRCGYKTRLWHEPKLQAPGTEHGERR
ncbi:hypothetical protein BKA56DRAFT_600398 [Ilyonectria sp. MPI-CAGE-AT-0026]|nr:hypothetical protein BKA56DRAFT_600398 [Ilyonectria sp. MPI-CAGE-AT-0026]